VKRLYFIKYLFLSFVLILLSSCIENPFTGKRTMALVGNSSLFASSVIQYNEFLNENRVISGTRESQMVNNAGDRIRKAAELWAASEGQSGFLNDYEWEYNLIESDEVNAWAMPGGKIVFYSGIMPVTENETGIAVVMGHEVAHAILNHGQQRASASILQQLGAVGINILLADQSREARALFLTLYGAGSTLFGTLPYSRAHEIEADKTGLILMIIAGYDPETAVEFWERMSSLGESSTPQFLSTHPSDENRVAELRSYIPEAKRKAERIGTIQ